MKKIISITLIMIFLPTYVFSCDCYDRDSTLNTAINNRVLTEEEVTILTEIIEGNEIIAAIAICSISFLLSYFIIYYLPPEFIWSNFFIFLTVQLIHTVTGICIMLLVEG